VNGDQFAGAALFEAALCLRGGGLQRLLTEINLSVLDVAR
jgi:hypothetical protein